MNIFKLFTVIDMFFEIRFEAHCIEKVRYFQKELCIVFYYYYYFRTFKTYKNREMRHGCMLQRTILKTRTENNNMDLHTSSYGRPIIHRKKKSTRIKWQQLCIEALYRFSEITSLVTFEASSDYSASRKVSLLAEITCFYLIWLENFKLYEASSRQHWSEEGSAPMCDIQVDFQTRQRYAPARKHSKRLAESCAPTNICSKPLPQTRWWDTIRLSRKIPKI